MRRSDVMSTRCPLRTMTVALDLKAEMWVRLRRSEVGSVH